MYSASADYLPTNAQPWGTAASCPYQLPPVLLFRMNNVWYGISLWPAWGSCPASVLSHLLVHAQPGREKWETENSIELCKHFSAITEKVCYQHYSYLSTKHNTITATRCGSSRKLFFFLFLFFWEENYLCPGQNLDTCSRFMQLLMIGFTFLKQQGQLQLRLKYYWTNILKKKKKVDAYFICLCFISISICINKVQ